MKFATARWTLSLAAVFAWAQPSAGQEAAPAPSGQSPAAAAPITQAPLTARMAEPKQPAANSSAAVTVPIQIELRVQVVGQPASARAFADSEPATQAQAFELDPSVSAAPVRWRAVRARPRVHGFIGGWLHLGGDDGGPVPMPAPAPPAVAARPIYYYAVPAIGSPGGSPSREPGSPGGSPSRARAIRERTDLPPLPRK